jgi:hypothetical protein
MSYFRIASLWPEVWISDLPQYEIGVLHIRPPCSVRAIVIFDNFGGELDGPPPPPRLKAPALCVARVEAGRNLCWLFGWSVCRISFQAVYCVISEECTSLGIVFTKLMKWRTCPSVCDVVLSTKLLNWFRWNLLWAVYTRIINRM